ncbi:MAG TPA: OsmC family protein, partial [Dissulfurispiraceae bacterium]|nr:OsmC family protein [Dissulfurispiraceae bacterium]
VLDGGIDDGGRNTGMQPMELLLVGIGSCSGMDIISVLEKKRQQVLSLDINVTGEKAVDYPKRYTEISLEWVITGKNISEEAVKHAIALSMEKYCSVKASLECSAKINFKYTIVNV